MFSHDLNQIVILYVTTKLQFSLESTNNATTQKTHNVIYHYEYYCLYAERWYFSTEKCFVFIDLSLNFCSSCAPKFKMYKVVLYHQLPWNPLWYTYFCTQMLLLPSSIFSLACFHLWLMWKASDLSKGYVMIHKNYIKSRIPSVSPLKHTLTSLYIAWLIYQLTVKQIKIYETKDLAIFKNFLL